MQFKELLVAAVVVLSGVSSASAAANRPQSRMWQDAQGNQLRARFVRMKDSSVVLVNGRKVTVVPLAALSPKDQEYVQSLVGGTAQADNKADASAAVEQAKLQLAAHSQQVASLSLDETPTPEQSSDDRTAAYKNSQQQTWETEVLKRGTGEDFSLSDGELSEQASQLYGDAVTQGQEVLKSHTVRSLIPYGIAFVALLVVVAIMKRVVRRVSRLFRAKRAPIYY